MEEAEWASELLSGIESVSFLHLLLLHAPWQVSVNQTAFVFFSVFRLPLGFLSFFAGISCYGSLLLHNYLNISHLQQPARLCTRMSQPRFSLGYLGGWLSCKEPACQSRIQGFNPWFGRIPGGGNGSPLQYSCLGNPMDGGAWWVTVPGVTKRSDLTYI